MPPPAQGAASSRGRRIALLAGFLLMILVAGVGVVLIVMSHPASSPAASRGTAHSPSPSPTFSSATLSATDGTTVFSDDFSDPNSGWTTQTLASGTTFAYQGGRYVVTAMGTLHHFAVAPFGEPIANVSAEMTATQNSDAPPGAGFGTVCYSVDSTATAVRYEALVENPTTWLIERRDGPVTSTSTGAILRRGTAPVSPGAAPITVTAACTSTPGSSIVHVVLFINGSQVTSLTDTAPAPPNGWRTGLTVSSRSTATSVVTVTTFVVRNLGTG